MLLINPISLLLINVPFPIIILYCTTITIYHLFSYLNVFFPNNTRFIVSVQVSWKHPKEAISYNVHDRSAYTIEHSATIHEALWNK